MLKFNEEEIGGDRIKGLPKIKVYTVSVEI
jgi:hypothetical protein